VSRSPRTESEEFIMRAWHSGMRVPASIAAQLNAQGLTTQAGTPWRARSVLKILRKLIDRPPLTRRMDPGERAAYVILSRGEKLRLAKVREGGRHREQGATGGDRLGRELVHHSPTSSELICPRARCETASLIGRSPNSAPIGWRGSATQESDAFKKMARWPVLRRDADAALEVSLSLVPILPPIGGEALGEQLA
jgi:hypothetical protein